MELDAGIPVQLIPHRVLQNLSLHLDVGTEHSWESLAECMNLDVLTITVSCFVV